MLACGSQLALPLAGSWPDLAVLLFGLGYFLSGVGVAMSNVHVVSLRQIITPDHLLGRMNASYRFVTYGAIPLGALVGGLLGEWIGLRATLLVGALGMLLAPLWVTFSPVPQLRQAPVAPAAPAAEEPTAAQVAGSVA
ncbi:MAG: hypothetical protein KatS3mg057_0527 [Herpetosiphonaceae bacterium]|nr:MAG: hypothetical protein KatS3mg057_0527 [Herpetosiphonaceae bacterium]